MTAARGAAAAKRGVLRVVQMLGKWVEICVVGCQGYGPKFGVRQDPGRDRGRRGPGRRCRELLGVVSLGTGLGGDDGGGYNHSDKGESDQKVMHGEVLLVRLLGALHD